MSKKASTLSKNILRKVQENAKKSGCSLYKSENPLYKDIPSEKYLLLMNERAPLRLKVKLVYLNYYFNKYLSTLNNNLSVQF